MLCLIRLVIQLKVIYKCAPKIRELKGTLDHFWPT